MAKRRADEAFSSLDSDDTKNNADADKNRRIFKESYKSVSSARSRNQLVVSSRRHIRPLNQASMSSVWTVGIKTSTCRKTTSL